jgi:hypothetical protein
MRDRRHCSWPCIRAGAVLAIAAIAIAWPRAAAAQYNAPPLSSLAIGERYHVELTGTLWNPDVTGLVSSDEFGQAGTSLDFVTDLGFKQTRFTDLKFVLRPARKHKLRFQYTPISYEGENVLAREIIFRGQKINATLPISTTFEWKVMRFGYEYDFVYRNRGFVGLLIEGRYTQFGASVMAPLVGVSEFTSAKAPLPALGLVGRAYIAPSIALNFEVSGMKLPDVDPKYKAEYFDWDINGTVNLTNNFGVQVGWRKMTTMLLIEDDGGDFKFQGLYFGASLRY